MYGIRLQFEADRCTGSTPAVIGMLCRSVMMISIPLLTCLKPGLTNRMSSEMQVSKRSFFWKVSGLTLEDRVRSSVIWGIFRVESLLLWMARSQLRRFKLSREVFPTCPSGIWIGTVQGLTEETISLLEWKCLWASQNSWSSAEAEKWCSVESEVVKAV